MTKQYDVKVGQVYEDNDSRHFGRTVRVLAVYTSFAVVIHENVGKHGRTTMINLDRFRLTNRGYRLVSDAPSR